MTMPAPRQELAVSADASRGIPTQSDVLERIIIHGDLSKLSQDQKVEYYRLMCESLGLNPNTRPFAYLVLNGKTVLYALRDCTDQLRRIHKVSVIETSQEEINGVYVVVCKVQNGEGRTDIARGAVDLGQLKGEALANAIMKTETKAKRRATLSICGLGVLDEMEIEDVTAASGAQNNGAGRAARNTSAEGKRDGSVKRFNLIRKSVAEAQECEMLREIADAHAQDMANFPLRWQITLSQEFECKWVDLGGEAADSPVPAMEDVG
jgi:hypothetical protein